MTTPTVSAARFPLRLKQARLRAGLTMEAAAAAVGLTNKQAYQAYEVGRVIPKIDLCERFAQVLGVDPAWLVGWKT